MLGLNTKPQLPIIIFSLFIHWYKGQNNIPEIEVDKPVDQTCMYACTNTQDYDDNCYWSCGLDSKCRWGSMMRCVDSRPDKQLNCVIDNGCFDFVEKYLNDSENERQHIIFMQKTQGVKLNLNDQLSSSSKGLEVIDYFNQKQFKQSEYEKTIVFLQLMIILVCISVFVIFLRLIQKEFKKNQELEEVTNIVSFNLVFDEQFDQNQIRECCYELLNNQDK